MTHVPEIGAGKMESIYGAGFWSVCHGLKTVTTVTLRLHTGPLSERPQHIRSLPWRLGILVWPNNCTTKKPG